jgi:flavodoxin
MGGQTDAGQPIAGICATASGLTREVMEWAIRRIERRVDFRWARGADGLEAYSLFLFFTPTWGDAELHPEMEDFLVSLRLRRRRFAICELGNYYGYEEVGFGAAAILRAGLEALEWEPAFPTLSLDSLPRVDWPALAGWLEGLNRRVC